MSNTLSLGATSLALPDDVLWIDEFAWQPVEQELRYTILGALNVEAAAKQAGRPITLEGGSNYGWINRAALPQLLAWLKLPGQVFALSYRSLAFDVIFDQSQLGFEAQPVRAVSDPIDADPYIVTFRFIEV